MLALNEQNLLERMYGWAPVWLWARLQHARHANTRRGSRRNIAYRYHLGNDFCRHWLDSGMTYSAARVDAPEQPLEQAQERKYARMLELTGAQPGEHLLKIGCGCGGVAEHAALRGYQVTGVTLSQAQLEWSKKRLNAAGLSARCDLRFCDYRDVSERFDHIVSIEMFEAVGEAYWEDYLQRLAKNLKHGGRAALQVITIDDAFFEAYQQELEFIQRYIFPGGMLPSDGVFDKLVANAGLSIIEREFGGLDYALALATWHDRFLQKAAQISALGFDPHFVRMWRYYLSYCEAGFRSGRIDVMRLALQHDE